VHACPGMPVDVKNDLGDYVTGMAAAAGASGRYYVMMEPVFSFAGPFVRLTLAKAAETDFNDTIFDRREIEISEGGFRHLNSKYGNMGRFETFDELSVAQAKHSAYLEEAMVFAKS
jgi:hypothetical protein